MSVYLVNDTDMTAIANAIRTKDGTQTTMTVSQMPTRIQNIPSSGGGGSLDSYINGTLTDLVLNVDSMISYAFYTYTLGSIGDNGTITSVRFTGNLQRIPTSAFSGQTRLTSVTFPNTLTEIGASAFKDCRRLPSISFPSSLTTIGGGAFKGCTALTSVTLPPNFDGITGSSVSSGIFEDCTSLTSVTLPTGMTTIQKGFVNGCTSLTSITIPNTVTLIDNEAFRSSGLTSITIPDSVTNIGSEAFRYAKITSVTLPANITSVGSLAFANNTSLTSFNIGSKQNFGANGEMGNSPLSGCTGLTNFTFGARGQKISEFTFGGNSSWVKNINFTWDPSISVIGESPLSGIEVGTLHIPSSVSNVGEGVAPSIDNLIVDNPRTYIGGYSFSGSVVSGDITLNQVTFEEECFNISGGSLTIHLTETDPTNISNGWAQTDAFSQYVSIKVPVGTLSYYQSALPDYTSLISEESN